MAMTNNAQITFEQFAEMLDNHTWADPAMAHNDYWKAAKAESKLWRLAQTLAGRGVEMYRQGHFEHLGGIRHAEYDKGAETYKLITDNAIAFLKKQLEETRQKYMTPLDLFKEKLDKHDWYYLYSDDVTVYRSGLAKEEALFKEAKEGGILFIDAFNQAKMNLKHGN